MTKGPYSLEMEHAIPLVGLYKYLRKVSTNTPLGEIVPSKAIAKELSLVLYNLLLLNALIFELPRGLETLLK